MGLETIREGVALETREHGPATGADTLVVWGHGLCNSMGGEDVERLWDFWRCPDGDPFAETARVVRYHARGHGSSSRASSPDECTWEALGDDMLALARLKRVGTPSPVNRISGEEETGERPIGADEGHFSLKNERREKLVLGGASMGSASAVFAAKRARDEAIASSHLSIPETCGKATKTRKATANEVDGLVLVIVPTLHATRAARSARIAAAAARGFEATAARRAPRPIFKGTPRSDEPATPLGVREDSFASVMRASASSDFPDVETLTRTFEKYEAQHATLAPPRVLVLCWDCGDATHPASSAAVLESAIPHARVEVATSLEQVETWGETIRGFIRSL
jgi:pimeloyl-ACP methyl ester carboxylesterase